METPKAATTGDESALWWARLEARVTARDVRQAAGRLRATVPNGREAPIELVVHLVEQRDDQMAKKLLAHYHAACERALAAAIELAELDPSVDIRPLINR